MTNFSKQYNLTNILKFKSKREQYFVWAALGIGLVFFMVKFGIEPFLASQSNIREQIPIKTKQLEKYRQYIAGKDQTEKNLKQIQELSKSSFLKLLSGDTPPLAAANLQDILKVLSAKDSINIKSEKVLDTKDLDFFVQISVQIEFISSITNLTNFLYDIENNEKLLIITDLNVRAASYRDPKEVRAAVVVAGLMKGDKK